MRAAYLNTVSGPEGLVVGELPRPGAGNGEVVIRVHATAITPTEFDWFPTFKDRSGEPRRFPIVLSHEFSGVVAELGAGVTEWSVGDAVFGMNDWFSNGAQAEYCVAPASALSHKPESLSDGQAATVPISALTAWQGLFDRGKLQAGESILIHGAAGGVGLFAVQLAHWAGARVIATASNNNLDFVHNLGADEVIDYKTKPFERVVKDVNVVFDVVGGETLRRSWSVLVPGGRMVTVASQSESAQEPRSREAFFIVEPNQAQLAEISKLLANATLQAFVTAAFAISAVQEAYTQAGLGGKRGKVVLEPGGN